MTMRCGLGWNNGAMTARRPDWAYDLARSIVTEVVAYYAAAVAAAPDDLELQALPPRQFVSEGVPAWDCEQLCLQVERIYVTNGNVAAAETDPILQAKSDKRAMQGSLILLRCAADLDDRDIVPDADEIQKAGRVVLRDAVMMENAIDAAIRAGSLARCRSWSLTEWVGVGPEGGLVGGVLRFAISRG